MGPGVGPPQSIHELSVALSPCDNDIHPDAHGLCRGGHHIVQPVMGLHTEGKGWVRALWSERGESKTRLTPGTQKRSPNLPLPFLLPVSRTTWSSGVRLNRPEAKSPQVKWTPG